MKSLVGLDAFGGQSTSPDRVALLLNQYGNVCGDAENETEMHVKRVIESTTINAIQARQGIDDEDSDFG